ncbi:MAG: cysteine-rich CWC family protein [Psychromonas sp.]|nr:cysteine-rich CWC family protein [Psychromonas sp.]
MSKRTKARSRLKTCPFCQQDNSCSANSTSCWCQQATIPSALIKLLPSSDIDRACICSTCINSFQQDPKAFKEKLNGKTE